MDIRSVGVHVPRVESAAPSAPARAGRGASVQQPVDTEEPPAIEPRDPIDVGSGHAAFFAVDGDGKVVIRVVDQAGQVINQIPDADQLRVMNVLMERVQRLVDRRA